MMRASEAKGFWPWLSSVPAGERGLVRTVYQRVGLPEPLQERLTGTPEQVEAVRALERKLAEEIQVERDEIEGNGPEREFLVQVEMTVTNTVRLIATSKVEAEEMAEWGDGAEIDSEEDIIAAMVIEDSLRKAAA